MKCEVGRCEPLAGKVHVEQFTELASHLRRDLAVSRVFGVTLLYISRNVSAPCAVQFCAALVESVFARLRAMGKRKPCARKRGVGWGAHD